MRRKNSMLLIACSGILACGLTTADAQLTGGGGFGGGGGGFGGGGGGGFGGGGGGGAGGIAIDSEGVLKIIEVAPVRPGLSAKRREAAVEQYLDEDLARRSVMRCVSLTRLEQACRESVESSEMVPEAMRYLAGLQRIDYVFVYPESRDLVIAGPAGAFAPDDTGRVVSLETGRPVLRLDDLIVALRSLRNADRIGVSIDPVPERLAQMTRYIESLPVARSVAQARSRYPEMAKILGLQNVTLWGVPPSSHFAQVLVEADVRMKRVSIGLENPRLRGFTSHLAMTRPGGNSLRRWWFTPLYEAVYRDESGTAYQFAGPRAQLMSQEEYSDAEGRRGDAAVTPASTERFSQQFTERFPELAERIPVFAELQNLMDLCVLTALIQSEQLAERVEWPMELFLDEELATVSAYPVPRSVPSMFNTRVVGRGLVIGLISGGVHIHPHQLVRELVRPADADARLGGMRPKPVSESERWWWD